MYALKQAHILFYFFIFLGFSQAQEVPNFIAKDINGVEHNLYDYLADDKVVIVDVFATWCSTCWNAHKSEKISTLYSTYGPNGTDQLVVLYIEGDIATSDANLRGDDTFGDWVTGIPFPIFNPSSLEDEFLEVFAEKGFPTTNVICPNSREIIADIYQDDFREIINVLQQCGTISNVTDLQIKGKDTREQRVCDVVPINVEVINSGTERINYFELQSSSSNGTILHNHVCDVTMEPGDILNVYLGDYKLEDSLENQEIDIILNFIDDEVPNNNFQKIYYQSAFSIQNKVTILMEADFWVYNDNTRWWVENSSGDIVIPIKYLEPYQKIEESFYLDENDCYRFIIAEDYGDGMLLGSVQLLSENGIVLYDDTNFSHRGEASFEYTGSLSTATSASLQVVRHTLTVTPNIITDELRAEINVPLAENFEMSIYNIHGAEVHRQSLKLNQGTNEWNFSTSALSSGTYLLQIQTMSGPVTEKFIKV